MKNTLTQAVQHAAVLASLLLAASVWAQTPQGEIKGEAVVLTSWSDFALK